jgi:hypothetical protein
MLFKSEGGYNRQQEQEQAQEDQDRRSGGMRRVDTS